MSAEAGLSWSEVLLVLLMALISALTVVGNLVVLLSFALDRQIRQPSNFFIFSLAVSDLIIGLEGIPVYTYFLVNGQRWPFGAFLCDLWLSVDYACCLASIYTVLGITADRYLSVKYPAAYRNWRTKRRVLLIIAGIWLVPSVLFSISIFGYGWFSGKGRILREDECYVQFMTNAYLNAGMYISYYWSTLALMLYLYYGIYSAAKQLASKSDQKQRRLALLAEMRQDGGAAAGCGAPMRPDSRDEPSLGLAMSEALATLDSSADSRPSAPRRVSARLLHALQNGRLLSLRTVVSAASKQDKDDDHRSTGGGSGGKPRGVANNAIVAVMPGELPTIEANRSTSLTTAGGGPNGASGAELTVAGTVVPSPEPEQLSEGAFSPDFGDEVPFIDESAQSSVQSSTLQQKLPKTPKKFVHVQMQSPFRSHSVPAPPPIAAANHSAQHPPAAGNISAPDCNNNSQQQQLDRARPMEFTLCSSLELFVPAEPGAVGSASAPPIRHHSVRMHVHVQREMSAQQGVVGMRRWLGAVRLRRLTAQSTKSSRNGGQQRKMSKGSQSRSENRARKALRTITVILGTFTLFWTPFYVLATVYGFCERCSSSAGFQALYTVSYYLCYMNSPINPLCYAAANQQFKRTFKRILRGDLRRN